MNKIVILSIILIISTISHLSGHDIKPIDLKITKAKTITTRLRNTGVGFLCFGIATIAGGSTMVSYANGVTYYSNTNYSGTEGSFTGAMGALGIVGGSISTVGGIAMTYFGQKKLNTSKRIQQKITFNFTPLSGSITYHF